MTTILTCPACKTNYSVKAEAIPPGGRTVKCTKCAHNWHFKPETTQEEKSAMQESSATENKASESPKKAQPRKALSIPETIAAPLWLKLLPVGLIPLMLVLFMALNYQLVRTRLPFLIPVYDTLGLYSTEGILLKDVVIKKEETEEKTGLRIEAKLMNVTKNDIRFPSLRISMLDKNKKEIAAHTIPSSGKAFEANATFPLTNKITRLPQEAKYLALDIGNKMDLFLR